MDMISDTYHNHLAELVAEGEVSIEVLDQAVRQILRIKYMLDLFNEPYTDPILARDSILKPRYLKTALEVTTQSMVLLKNLGGQLPINTEEVKRIALIGPLADDHHEYPKRIGQAHHPLYC